MLHYIDKASKNVLTRVPYATLCDGFCGDTASYINLTLLDVRQSGRRLRGTAVPPSIYLSYVNFLYLYTGQYLGITYQSPLPIPDLLVIHIRRLAKVFFTLKLYHGVNTIKLC
jgi:hypothetical protein